MKQIQKIKVQTPIFVQMMFLIALLPGIILFCYFTGKASASTVRDNRTVQCQNAFIGYEYNPKLEKQCRPLWIKWTNSIKRGFINNK